MSIYDWHQLFSNPADGANERLTILPDRFCIGYIRLGTRLGVEVMAHILIHTCRDDS